MERGWSEPEPVSKHAGSPVLRLAANKALLVALIYLLIGVLWILGSDSLLNAMVGDPARIAELQTWKGWFFVIATAVLLYLTLYRLFRSEAAQLLRQFRQQEELDLLNQFRASIIDDANVWINVLDAQARVTVWNKAAERISGYRREDVVGSGDIWAWLYPDDNERNAIARRVRAILDDGFEVEGFETRMRCRDGQYKIIAWNQRRFVAETGEIGSIAIGQDVTERKRLQQELERLAVLDHLTGLYNRREFEARIAVQFDACRASKQPISLLWIDIDCFKEINDRFGHQAGDEVLCGVARLMQELAGTTGIPARQGGDELIIALPAYAATDAAAVGEDLCRRVREAKLLGDGDDRTVTISVGVAACVGPEATLSALISAADQAMYRAKASGRNRVCMAEA